LGAFESLAKGQHPEQFTERQKEKFDVPEKLIYTPNNLTWR
jgi:lipopolysaccharide export system protein LptC